MANDPLQEAWARAKAAYARLDALYPQRNDDPSAFQAALDELNEATTALTVEWNKV